MLTLAEVPSALLTYQEQEADHRAARDANSPVASSRRLLLRSRFARVGRRAEDDDVPRDATLVAVIRERHVIVPRGETGLAAGDEVLVLVTPETEDEVRALLVSRSG